MSDFYTVFSIQIGHNIVDYMFQKLLHCFAFERNPDPFLYVLSFCLIFLLSVCLFRYLLIISLLCAVCLCLSKVLVSVLDFI